MRPILFALIAIHGLVHFIGFAKAYGFAELALLTQPVSKGAGLLWLAAGVLLLVAAVWLLVSPGTWWAPGFAAVAPSQAAIFTSWGDAKFGTAANLLILAAAIYAFASAGPTSFRAEYLEKVKNRLSETATPAVLTEEDLAHLPEPVRCYVRQSKAVGRPKVRHFRAVWRGRIRREPGDPWMELTATQHNFAGDPARYFFMEAKKGGLPVDGIHVFEDRRASMRIKLLSLLPIVRSQGEKLDRAETVTLLNDMCVMAPAALIDPAIRWEEIDDSTARAHYTHGDHTVSAELFFNEDCELVDFVSDDRLAATADGEDFVPMRWSTPLRDYKDVGSHRVCSRGQGRWHPEKAEDYAYLELELVDLEINGDRP